MAAPAARVTLLGPQRRPTVSRVAADLPPDAAVATVTAGWQEREGDDDELRGNLGGRGTNLALYRRWLDVLDRDPELAIAAREHDAVLGELQQLYLVQLDAALTSFDEVARRSQGRERVRSTALADAEAVVRLVDERHLARMREAEESFDAAWQPRHRAVVAGHAAEVRQVLDSAAVLVVAGGHVGVLLRVLRLFAVTSRVPPWVVAWSAGAMALTDRVMLFHDLAAHGPSHAEFYATGGGLVPGVVALPHARRRLRVDDVLRMSTLARRAAPARCLVLDDGARIELGADRALPAEAPVVHRDGHVGPPGGRG